MADVGSDAGERRATITEAVVDARKSGSRVQFAAEEGAAVAYADREIVLEVGDDERERLDTLLGKFPVFKIAQPATRKAPDGEVHVSALADPKHTADFMDRLFLDVFECGETYDVVVDP